MPGARLTGWAWSIAMAWVAVQVVVPAAGQAPAGSASARVALTFDDLPAHGPLPPGVDRVDVAKRILDALRSHRAPPTYGFVNAKRLEEQPDDGQVLELWRAAGFPLGNHGFSHMDLHTSSLEAFGRDVLANEATLRRYMGDGDWRWFRFPFLHEGETAAKHEAVFAFLKRHGYRIAPVTLSFDDYAYNEPYARCLAKSDSQALDWLRQSYLERAGESLTRGRDASQALLGRDISHVMLLHVGAFQIEMLPRLLDLLRERGFTLTTLEDAAGDTGYAPDLEFQSRWRGAERAAAPTPAPARPYGDLFEKLRGLCR